MTARAVRRAVVVCDLGFGDAGKGLLTDWLAARLGARWVIRWNGGAQAGHNVVLADGRHHTFAQLGAGTFRPGVRTFLGPDVVLHPGALLVEAERLAALGVGDALSRLWVSGAARVVTPWHQATGRLRELCRGGERHGSCGVGVGEVVGDDLRLPGEALRAADLRDRGALVARARRLAERKRAEAALLVAAAPQPEGAGAIHERDAIARELAVLDDAGLAERWAQLAHAVIEQVNVHPAERPAPFLAEPAPLVLEGAQGVLLDEDHGFHPHTTWSRCGFPAAGALLDHHGFEGQVVRLGVLRAYAVRHGPGPLPTEDRALGAALVEAGGEPHNVDGPWQGPFRVGWPDFVLGRYALAAAGGADALLVTHLDAAERLGRLRAAGSYRLAPEAGPIDEALAAYEPDERRVRSLRVAGPPLTGAPRLERQARLGRLLASAAPEYRPLDGEPSALCAAFEEALGVEVALGSFGPRAEDVRVRASRPGLLGGDC